MHTLATAHDQRLDNIIDQLLQDFLQVWPDDYSTQFVDECLPLLFNIFRFSKVIILCPDVDQNFDLFTYVSVFILK